MILGPIMGPKRGQLLTYKYIEEMIKNLLKKFITFVNQEALLALFGTDRIYSSGSKLMYDEEVTLWTIKYLLDFKTISTEIE